MKKDTKDSAVSKSSMQELQIEQIKLSNTNVAHIISERSLNMKANRIEQARRNVEVLSRAVGTFQDDVGKKMTEVLMLNLEVLKEVNKL